MNIASESFIPILLQQQGTGYGTTRNGRWLLNISKFENIIAYDGIYENGKFSPLDAMPPHEGRHRAILLLLDEAPRTREYSMWKAHLGDEEGNPYAPFPHVPKA